MPSKSLADVSLTITQALAYGFFSFALHDFNNSHPEDLMTRPWKYVVLHVVQVCSEKKLPLPVIKIDTKICTSYLLVHNEF